MHDQMTLKKEAFEKELKTYLNCGESSYQNKLLESMRYSLNAGGKRIRPIILLEIAQLYGVKKTVALPFAVALEMIHTYSLIHDDLPAMDDDDLRRGRPTNHKVYGEAHAILAGDALLNYAHTLMFETVMSSGQEGPCSYASLTKAALEISKNAGLDGMVVGQIADIENEGMEIDIETLNYINEKKTGALLEAAFVSGGLLADINDAEINKLRRIAKNVGLCFQIIDDILDIEGDTLAIGKPAGSDAKNGKSTYPFLLSLEISRKKAAELTDEALQIVKTLEGAKENKNFIEVLIHQLLQRKI